jgi:hypothetical protein
MANSNVPLLTGASLYISTSVAGTALVVSAASTVIYEMELDNTANAAATYLRMHNTGTVTPGTTTPDQMLMIPASTKIALVYPSGVTFGTALTITAGTSATLATVTAPSSAFALKIVYV